MTLALLLLVLWSGDTEVARGWVSGPLGGCTYAVLRSGRTVPWFPVPCTVLQLGRLRRSMRNLLYNDRGEVIGSRTAGPGYVP